MTRIIYDNIIYKLQKFGGISTYWFELSQRLIADPNFHCSFIEYDSNNLLKQSLSDRTIIEDRSRAPLLVERFVNPKLNEAKIPFIFHSSYNRFSANPIARNVTTVHDIIHHKFYGGVRSLLHNCQKKNAVKHSDVIITVSENTKRDILKIYPWLEPERIHVIYNGVSSDYCMLDDSYRYEIPYETLQEKYIVCVSSREPYKNFPFVIDVVSQIPDYQLYIVGPKLKVSEVQLLDRKMAGRWRMFTSVSNRALNEIYNRAVGMIYPSSYEGFGIPVLEAMKAGCPTITLNTSSIPEVAGDASIMIDELRVSDFLDGFERLISNRDYYVQKGFLQANKFSWDKCYQQTSELYKQIEG